MSYYTGAVKSPFQDPVRKETTLKVCKPLNDSMLKRISYFISRNSKKMTYNSYMQNKYGKEDEESQNSEIETYSNASEENKKKYHIYANGKDYQYNKIRRRLMSMNDTNEFENVSNYIPPKILDQSYQISSKIVSDYQMQKQIKPKSLTTLINTNEMRKYVTNQAKKIHGKKDIDDIQSELNEFISRCHTASYTNSPRKRKAVSNRGFKQRQFDTSFRQIVADNQRVPPTKLSNTDFNSSFNTTQKLMKPENDAYPYKRSKTQIKHRKVAHIVGKYEYEGPQMEKDLSSMLMRQICTRGFLRKKYVNYMVGLGKMKIFTKK